MFRAQQPPLSVKNLLLQVASANEVTLGAHRLGKVTLGN